MDKKRVIALILAAAGLQCLAGCGKNKKDDSMPLYAETPVETTTEPPVGGADISGDKYDSEAYQAKINEHVKAAELTDAPLVLGSVGKDIIVPDEGAEDSGLGTYRVSSSGIKLYYDETVFPEELMLTLEKYFTSFPSADYATYSRCVFPSYITEMESFLEKNYNYDLKASFSKQCSTLAEKMKGDYRITRIKLEEAPVYEEGKDNIENYFSSLDEVFEKDYLNQVKEESDELIDACFYVMAEDPYGKEQMLVAEYEIVFAVKDGKYYTFG
ncbi:hypothetical protein [Ruminococcus flavefaciens]|jgi:hypothetical protein|uniref:hypothetical protein n=1 Tax=Ruminococcus flavefaciens TaxID=1265 RepID=UPI00048FEFFF|nr:hypothetical protein [Ruminococcus flavefaciens]